jgi:hypothetical protein
MTFLPRLPAVNCSIAAGVSSNGTMASIAGLTSSPATSSASRDRARVGACHHVCRGDVAPGEAVFVGGSQRRGGAAAVPNEFGEWREAFRLVDEVNQRVDTVRVALAHGRGKVLLRRVDRLDGAELA